MVLNLNRDSMASVGFSPPTRVFEAAGEGACVVTDAWTGIETFFEPGEEILLVSDANEIVDVLRNTSDERDTEIGTAMRRRAQRHHTYRYHPEQLSELHAQDGTQQA